MTDALLSGAIAGLAIAIPVGAIAVLIVELGIRRGFAAGAAAGLGAASADGLYASLAVLAGSSIAATLAPIEGLLRIVAAGVLLGVALRQVVGVLLGPRGVPSSADVPVRPLPTYARFLAITLLNPATLVYFAALMIGRSSLDDAPADRLAFALGAFLASACWQLILAGVGAIAHHRLPARFQAAVSLLGAGLIAWFALGVATGR